MSKLTKFLNYFNERAVARLIVIIFMVGSHMQIGVGRCNMMSHNMFYHINRRELKHQCVIEFELGFADIND